MFARGSRFDLSFVTATASADSVAWSIRDYLGNVRASGTFTVAPGARTTRLSCTSAASGYFAVAARLRRAGDTLPRAGTRPAGIATFGILPDVSEFLPPAVFAHQDQHRFGMQGFNGNGRMLADLGVSQTIDDRQMAVMEPEGPDTWTPSLSTVPERYKKGSVMRLVRLDGIPGWASPTGAQTSAYAPIPARLDYFRRYMARVGKDTEAIRRAYYPNQRHNYYQVTWEPGLHWRDSAVNFVAMYAAAYKGLHSTDPNAVVMGTSDFPAKCPPCTTGALKNDAGLSRYIDGVTTHAYWDWYNTPNNPPERYDDDPDPAKREMALDRQMQTLRAAMQRAKPNMRLWSTEFGVSYDSGSQYGPDFPTANQLYAQAVVAARAHLIILGEGAQVTYFFYGPDYPKEVGFGTFFDDDHPQGSYSATNLSPKPEALALAAMTRIVDGTQTLGRLERLPPTVHGYAFQRLGNGPVVTALWAHDNAQWPTRDGIYNSTYRTPFSLTVDEPTKRGTVIVFDMMGNATRVPFTEGVAKLSLTASPIYVVSSNAKLMKSNVTAPIGYVGQ
ncbi:hypothetical protein DWV00_06980 [Trinickia dinghuensis]|uniref:Uncharacterized protein n=1 Tax=Trinickia dinghuensis TaxID=2291023 RepID=A0A3D8K4R2_9BURK|nr:hypothetical protein DWV00_06980 [Trinickia dinghuensis]